MWETWVWSLGWGDPLEKEMVTHSSILAWRIPWTEKPGRLQSMGSQRVGHDWATSSFTLVLSQSFWLRVLPGGACLVQPRWMPERRILGGSWTSAISFWPFLNSSCWWRLISSVFLSRTSCHKTTHANGYYGAWPGWAVSISVLPLTILHCIYVLQHFSF